MDEKNKDAAKTCELNDEKLKDVSGGAFVTYAWDAEVVCNHPLATVKNAHWEMRPDNIKADKWNCPYYKKLTGSMDPVYTCLSCVYSKITSHLEF